jgi:hypothetical protein
MSRRRRRLRPWFELRHEMRSIPMRSMLLSYQNTEPLNGACPDEA